MLIQIFVGLCLVFLGLDGHPLDSNNNCMNKDPICGKLTDDPKYFCKFNFIKSNCPILCDTCDMSKTTTMAPTTTTTERPIIGSCEDVSIHCDEPVCTWSIYQRRCRKACGLCDSPLPYGCRGTVDTKSDCASRAKKGECRRSSYYMKNNCKQSCCLRRR